MVRAKIVSSMEKVFCNTAVKELPAAERHVALKGERVQFQVVLSYKSPENPYGYEQRREAVIGVRSPLFSHIQLSRVGNVPVELPVWKGRSDDDYISKEPGLYPDVLLPLKNRDKVYLGLYTPVTLFVSIDVPQDLPAGEYPVYFTFTEEFRGEKFGACHAKAVLTVKDAVLPKSDLIFTQWFHCDSIASYHGVKMMSEKHWRLIDNYMRTAARTGINMLLTPVFTPALDTPIGGERATMQLVKIEKHGEQYSFDFADLHRWVELCHKNGIRYFEMAHLYTQWGAQCCPKIIVREDGKAKKLFGWHVQGDSELYRSFLSQFLPALTAELTKMGIAQNCYFHISDEPSIQHLENYKKAKAFVAPYLKGFKMMDALSNVEYYRAGLVDYPVCATNHIEPFLQEKIDERWCYYCCSQIDDVSNRMMAMPSRRNRALGVTMYMNDIAGFLQWGYNFYFSEISRYKVNPYTSGDSMQSYPAGDAFSVYPYEDGAIESLRTAVFYQALQDRMLLKALENKLGAARTHAFVEQLAGEKITFRQYPRTDEFYTRLHDEAIALLTGEQA